jgi:sugar phosphate permease
MTLAGLGLICFGLFTNSLLLFIFTWTMMVSVGTNIGAFAPSWAALNNWFIRKKGQAMGLGMASQALGGFLIAPLAAFLIVAFSGNWRMAAVALGVMLLALVVPVTRFVRNHPEEMGLAPDGRKPGEAAADRKEGAKLQGRQWEVVHFSVKQAMRTPALWFLIASMSMWQFGSQSIVLHLGVMVGDAGYSLSVAGLVVGLLAFMGILGALGSGWLSDRIERRKVMGAIVFTQALSLIVLLLSTQLWQIILFAAVFGIGQGAHAINRSMLGEYFGQTHYARLWGIISMCTTPFAAVGPVFAGVAYDRTGSYDLFIITLIGVYVLAALAYYSTRRPTAPKVAGVPAAV